jgi:Zn-dependent metalloprotease
MSCFCTILPPHILIAIAQRARDARQRAAAIDTLALDGSHRLSRVLLHLALARRHHIVEMPAEAQRVIYDAHNHEIRRGTLVRAEGQPPTGDPATDEAYDGLGVTFDFWRDCYGRNSIDGDGMGLDAIVHFGRDYMNAFWDGERMVFGDGDGKLFDRFTIALDIIAHELTHGVTEAEGGLAYIGQSGALNEHVSDVFASCIKQRVLKQTADKGDWLIGEGLLIGGGAIRSVKEPGTAYDNETIGRDPQPADMNNYVRMLRDNGGVHINSGIPNRAFYLAATAIGGFAWEKTGQVWYDTLRDSRLDARADFAAFAGLTEAHARRRYGDFEQKAIADAWSQVGVKPR